MANVRVSAFFRPWNNGTTDEMTRKQITGDGSRCGHLNTIPMEQNNSGHSTSRTRDKENNCSVKNHAAADCTFAAPRSEAVFVAAENANRIASGRNLPLIEAGSSSCSVTSERGESDFYNGITTSPEVSLSSAATVLDTSLLVATPSFSRPEAAWPMIAPGPVDYLRRTGIYHPSMSVSSVIWPIRIVPNELEPSPEQATGQPLYYDHPGNDVANELYSLSFQHAARIIQRQEETTKAMKKLRPKRFRCDHCDVAFSNNGQLKGHIRIHTGERPFKCDAEGCGKTFTRNEELTRHKRIHTGVRPHACMICGKCFGRKDHLKKHTRTHENRDLYATSAAAMGMYALGHAAPPFPPYVFHI